MAFRAIVGRRTAAHFRIPRRAARALIVPSGLLFGDKATGPEIAPGPVLLALSQ